MPPQEVRGNTLRVYLHVLKHGPCELREVQRGIGLSTPSLASYHLGRLVTAGYVKQDELGRYVTTGSSSGEILSGYSKVGAAVVPQVFFFTLLFTILVAFFSVEVFFNIGFTIYLVLTSSAMVLALWYQTVRLWRKLVT